MMLKTDLIKAEKLIHAKVHGKAVRIVREQYLRDDISCHSPLCSTCQNSEHERVGQLGKDVTHYLIPFYDIVKKYAEILEAPEITGIIFLQSIVLRVIHDVGKLHYNKLLNLVRDQTKGCTLFLNDLHKETFLEREKGQAVDDWLAQSSHKVAVWYLDHLQGQVPIVMVTEDEKLIETYKNEVQNVLVVQFKDYLKNFWPSVTSVLELYESVATAYCDKSISDSAKIYSNHLSMETVAVGIKNRRLIKGKLIVNKYHAQKEATVAVSGGTFKEEIILISGMKYRNRAIHGDEVVVELFPESEWQSTIQSLRSESEDDVLVGSKLEKLVPTGKVVGIVQRRWRDYVAVLPDDEDYNKNVSRFLVIPYNYRIPKIRITTKQALSLRTKRIVVRIDNWEANSQYPNGHFVKSLGEIGELETEVATLLLENEISVIPFSAALKLELPTDSPQNSWKMDDDEVSKRKDLRETHLVFSIDPIGCQDVDDTLSVRQLENGNMELGVHIADVTYFVRPQSLADSEAKARGTTVYLADRRFDMLPSVLSSGVCSLFSQVDRYAVSVLWELNSKCEVIKVWYGRTVINSTYKLFYEVAQELVDGKDLTEVVRKIPELDGLEESEVKMRYNTLKEALLNLTNISRKLKSRRLQGGGVQLESLEVQFEVIQDETVPKPKEHLEIHETVAECMIFANHYVAKRIYSSFPHRSLLRFHPAPQKSKLKELQQLAETRKQQISFDSPKQLSISLDRALDPSDPTVNIIFRSLATQAMSEALYFSTGCFPENEFSHFGLGLDRYTHFTSPIRRYADIVVHRLLLSAVGEIPLDTLTFTSEELQEIAQRINIKHKAAQITQKSSADLFKAFYFQKLAADDSQCKLEGIIYSLRQNGVLVIVPQYGLKGALSLRTKDQKVPLVTSNGVTWTEGRLVRSESSLVVEAGSSLQAYRVFDHLRVQVKVQMSRAHGSTLYFELLGFVSLVENCQSNITQKVDLVKEMQLTVAEEKTEEMEIQTEKKNPANSLYHLILSIRELSLQYEPK